MAAASLSPALLELVDGLNVDDVPIRFRCANCSKCAINAFKLPCCSQVICGTCQTTLPQSCPVCEHSPVAAEDCNPVKSLRTTISIWLKTKLRERDVQQAKESANTPQEAPAESPAPSATQEPTPAPKVDAPEAKPESNSLQDAVTPAETENVQTTEDAPSVNDTPLESEKDVAQPSIEAVPPGQEQTTEDVEKSAYEKSGAADEGKDTSETANADTSNASANGGQSVSNQPGLPNGLGAMPPGGFPAMGFGAPGDFNQMQMMNMMAMQNGMGPAGFGAFPMMGMPGMGMESMGMPNMFMNGGYGAQGMGVNGINMGAGMGNFNGNMGSGFNDGWNGQQSWNIGQDNFNPNAAGMGPGDFGANNSGYAASGYNQGNYGRANQFNNYQQPGGYGYGQGYSGRGRGRGRGGFSAYRGNPGYGQQNGFSQQMHDHMSAGPNEAGGPKAPSTGAVDQTVTPSNVDEFGRTIPPADQSKDSEDQVTESQNESSAAVEGGSNLAANGTGSDEHDMVAQPSGDQTDDGAAAPTFDTNDTASHTPVNGTTNDAGWSDAPTPMGPPSIPNHIPKVVDVPLNAPTGPKAMREGLPNTSLRNLGISIPGRTSSRMNGSHSGSTSDRHRSTSPDGNRSKRGAHSRPPSPSRSRSRSRDRHRRHRRHRSESLSEDSKESERRRERRRRRREQAEDEEARGVRDGEKGRNDAEERTRSTSPGEPRSHRSRTHRDRDRERDRSRDRSRDHKSSSHRHRSHRSRRDRSYSRDRDRDRERDREHRHRHRHASEEKEKTETSGLPSPLDNTSAAPTPTIPDRPRAMSIASAVSKGTGIEIKGASRRSSTQKHASDSHGGHSSRSYERRGGEEKDRHSARQRERERERPSTSSSSRVPMSKPVVDPIQAERDARDRERLLKETQRMAGLARLVGAGGSRASGVKRGRDDEDWKRSSKSRRKSESEDARLERLEREREGDRWD